MPRKKVWKYVMYDIKHKCVAAFTEEDLKNSNIEDKAYPPIENFLARHESRRWFRSTARYQLILPFLTVEVYPGYRITVKEI